MLHLLLLFITLLKIVQTEVVDDFYQLSASDIHGKQVRCSFFDQLF